MTSELSNQRDTSIFDRVRHGLSRVSPLSSYAALAPEVEDPGEFSISDPFACAYLETRAGRQLTDSSIKTYENHLEQYLSFLEDRQTTLLDAQLTDVIEFVEHCVDRGNRQSTIEGKVTAIRELYTFIRLRTKGSQVLSLDPIEFHNIDLSAYNTPPSIEREPLSRKEVRQLFDVMKSYRNRLMIVVAIETGLRNSDLRNLRVDDVDFEHCKIHVRDPKNGIPYEVPISRELRAELEVWRDRHLDGYVQPSNDKYLFPAQNGSKITSNSTLNNIVTSAASRAGIQSVIGTSTVTRDEPGESGKTTTTREWKRVTVHTLRHTCLALMNEDGVPLHYRQLVANHRDPKTTQHYSHSKEEEFETIRNRYDVPRW